MRSALLFDGTMRVTESGGVYRINNGHERPAKLSLSPEGYLRTSHSENGQTKILYVHRLVAAAFIENPNNHPVVNHLDGIKTNNNATNLEWCTVEENARHASRLGLLKRPENTNPPPRRFSISLPPELQPALQKLKQEQFFDKSQTEMLMHIIRLGLEAAKGKHLRLTDRKEATK